MLATLGLTCACAWPAAAQLPPPTCRGNLPTILGTPGNDTITGTPARDVIYADAGDDTVLGVGAGDVICGGTGNDILSGGGGNDRINGDDGADFIGGDRGNDRADGGAGDGDRLRGGLGDDQFSGGPGHLDDVAGDLGIDVVGGGDGDFDIVRGDSGADTMTGGPGIGDIASFATASPDSATGRGVTASLATGTASGDGNDTVAEFEDLEGSAFADTLSGDGADNRIAGGPGDDRLDGGGGIDSAFGGPGSDRCVAFASQSSCGDRQMLPDAAIAQVVPSLAGGSGVVVTGATAADRLTVSLQRNGNVLVRSEEGPIAPRKGCTARARARRTVDCVPLSPVRYVVVVLGPGDDRLVLGPGRPLPGSVRAAGGSGDDVIRGGAEDDSLEASDGSDRLFGGGGSDGLLGGVPGPDLLGGQRGDDLLIAATPCVGGRLIGNAGDDNASFARTPPHPGTVMRASLEAGVASIPEQRGCETVGLDASLEDLEGTFGPDILIGDDGDNNFFGQPGADEFFGLAGNDVVNARDGRIDRVIDCGPGEGDVAVPDADDPAPQNCESLR